ncbi:unnamed protein product [Adineta steineri]|uniref:Uncharacterized protein n=1 Tax=Adineta steineri TaxID=433720 RepID=A0A815JJJ4_9BILA|nr:unnamed protein product [Adineta steineri]CAF3941502.1 unnamed protein product [Adineta steineri]
MDSLLRPLPPYNPLPILDDDNNPVIERSHTLTKKRILIPCITTVSLVILLIILIILRYNGSQSSTISDTVTNVSVLNQSSIRTTETVSFSPESCPIPHVTAKWNNSGNVFINRLGECLSNKYGLCNPGDLFIDDIHETLYVADTNNSRIQKYSLSEIYNSEIGATGITVASKNLISPHSIFVDTITEDMYIMDFDQNFGTVSQVSYRVHLWKKNDTIGRILLTEASDYSLGYDSHYLTLDKQMNIYVGTTSFITKWSASTDYTERTIVAGMVQYDEKQAIGPAAFVVTDDLTLYIADWSQRRIQKWKVNAARGTTVIGNLSYVKGLTMDCNGFLYLVDTFKYTISQFNIKMHQNRVIVNIKDLFKEFMFHLSTAIKIDKFGNIFLIGVNQIYKFSIVNK